MRLELGENGGGDLVLDGEHVGQFAIIGLRPQVEAVVDLDQLRGDAHRGARLAHRALEDVLDAQGVADLPQVLVLALEGEGGGAAGDLQVLDLGQRVQDLFGDAVGEVFLLGVRGHVDERQHGDRLRCRLRGGAGGFRGCFGHHRPGFILVPVLDPGFPDEITQRDHQDQDHRAVQLAAGDAGDGLAAVHVLFLLQPFRRQFEGPGEDQRQREADDQHHQDGLDHPARRVEALQHEVGHLCQQPGRDQVHDADADDVAAFQFLEESALLTHAFNGSRPSSDLSWFRCSSMRAWIASYSGSPSRSRK